jgi:hypothetical protein
MNYAIALRITSLIWLAWIGWEYSKWTIPLTEQAKNNYKAGAVIGVIAFGTSFLGQKPASRGFARHQAAANALLDRVLMSLGDNDVYRLKDLLTNACIIGHTGSGKTSSSGFVLKKAIAAIRGSGGLILASSDQDVQLWTRIFAAAGRQDDLLIFDAGSPYRFNVLDYERRSGADARELKQCFLTISAVLKQGKHQGGENEAFWEGMKERILYNAIVVLLNAHGAVSVALVAEFINNAAATSAQLTDEEWRQGLHFESLKKAHEGAQQRGGSTRHPPGDQLLDRRMDLGRPESQIVEPGRRDVHAARPEFGAGEDAVVRRHQPLAAGDGPREIRSRQHAGAFDRCERVSRHGGLEILGRTLRLTEDGSREYAAACHLE